MSKVVIVRYTVSDAFKIPVGIDLEDKSVVKSWGVKWNKLYITFVDDTEKIIESKGWINNADYKYPDEDRTTIESDEDSDDDTEEEEIWECDECLKDLKETDISRHLVEGGCLCKDCDDEDEDSDWDGDLDFTPNCHQCGEDCGRSIIAHQKYKKTYFCSKKCHHEYDGDDSEDDDEDVLCCEKCGYEDYKNDDGEWTEVLTHAESDRVFCKQCMPK